MRNLARIELIESVRPVENADSLDVCQIQGWEVVVKRGDFKPGDYCVYLECDAKVPDHPVFEFMRARKFRVKIIKLRGQISMGLAMPVDILKEFTTKKIPLEIGYCVSEILGVVKHDPQAEKEAKQYQQTKKKLNPVTAYMMSFQWFRHLRYKLGFERLKNFPYFISKTDEERIENMPQVLRQWKDDFYVSEKLDGSSITTAIWKEDKMFSKKKFYVCSRNICLYSENNSIWWKVARDFEIKEKLLDYGKPIGVQGEIVGPGVQGNIYHLDELDFYIYNVIDLTTRKRFTLKEKKVFCLIYDFKLVPILEENYSLENVTVDSLLKKADGVSTLHKTKREGLVVRSMADDHLSFKIISPKFLLEQKDES